MPAPLTGAQMFAGSTNALWDEFARIHGDVPPVWQVMRRRWPEFFAAYAHLAAVPWRRGVLAPKTRELVLVAVNAAVTHLNRDAIRTHIRNALGHGASADEIMEVLQLVSVLGIHATSVGFPALLDVARETGNGHQLPGTQLDAKQEGLKREFSEKRGYWSPFWEDALKLDTPLFEAYYDFSSVPWKHGVLEPKVREFVYVAIDASTTHMFDLGTRGHMANAFGHGATLSELLEVLELTVPLGIQTATTGLEILIEELEARGETL
jgi:alkylhydroperoxidase/carboxymuconolactone decarboxylase family protein YurZ